MVSGGAGLQEEKRVQSAAQGRGMRHVSQGHVRPRASPVMCKDSLMPPRYRVDLRLILLSWVCAGTTQYFPVGGHTLWLDASDPGSFIFSVDNVLITWRDKSGAGNHFTVSCGQPPTTRINDGGLSVVNFPSGAS
jgi:hypothetical protein